MNQRYFFDTNQMQRVSRKGKLSRSSETFSYYEEIRLQFYPIDDRKNFILNSASEKQFIRLK